jgi:lysophospholipase L1-like esterase
MPFLVPVATKAVPNYNTNTPLSDGTVTGGTAAITHTCLVTCYGIVLAFANFYNNNGSETDGPQAITVAAAVVPTTSKVFPVTFNGGQSQVTIQPGKWAFSDPIGITLNKGDTFQTRTYVNVAAAATKFPTGSYTTQSSLGEGENYTSGGGTNNTTPGSVGVTAVNGVGVFAPAMILGYAKARISPPRILLVGDSIMAGVGDGGTFTNWGYVLRALNNNYPYQLLAYPSETVDFMRDNQRAFRRLGMVLTKMQPSAIICELGVNSVKAGSGTIQADLLTIWQQLANFGVPLYQTTITPVTTSTDSWATTANQTVTANESIRTALNDYIRTVPSPLTGIFEVADLAETSRNSGIWRVTGGAYTGDGTHPSAVGHAALAAAITPQVFGSAAS